MCTYNGEKYLREQMDSILRKPTLSMKSSFATIVPQTVQWTFYKNTLQNFHSSKYTEIHETKDAIKTFMIILSSI